MLGISGAQIPLRKCERQTISAEIICRVCGLLVKQCAETRGKCVSSKIVHVQCARLDQWCLSWGEDKERRIVDQLAGRLPEIQVQIHRNKGWEHVPGLACKRAGIGVERDAEAAMDCGF